MFFLESLETNHDSDIIISEFNEQMYLYESEYKDLLIESTIAEFKAYNEGVVSKVWTGIKNFFKKIIKMIQNLFSKIKNLFKKSTNKEKKLKDRLAKAQNRVPKIGDTVIAYTGLGFNFNDSLFTPKGENAYAAAMKKFETRYINAINLELGMIERSNNNPDLYSMDKLNTLYDEAKRFYIREINNALQLNQFGLSVQTDMNEFTYRANAFLDNKDADKLMKDFIDSLKKTKDEAQSGIDAINKLPENEVTDQQKVEIKVKKDLVKAYQYKISLSSLMYSDVMMIKTQMMKSIEQVTTKILKAPKV